MRTESSGLFIPRIRAGGLGAAGNPTPWLGASSQETTFSAGLSSTTFSRWRANSGNTTVSPNPAFLEG